MGKNNKIAVEVSANRMIIMYPDLYRARTFGLRGIFRKIRKWFLGRSVDMSEPFYSPGRLNQNGR